MEDDKLEEKKYNIEDPVVSKVEEIDLSGTYSYAQYLKWEIDERLELIKGKIFAMSAPNRNHQKICGHIFYELYDYLKPHPCEVYIAPFDVRLANRYNPDSKVFTVVQPDICVVCDQNKLDEKGCIGAPDIMVEILSPGNNAKEMKNKYDVYEESGVREYWVVVPAERILLQYVLNEAGVFEAQRPITGKGMLVSVVLPGFQIEADLVFKGITE